MNIEKIKVLCEIAYITGLKKNSNKELEESDRLCFNDMNEAYDFYEFIHSKYEALKYRYTYFHEFISDIYFELEDEYEKFINSKQN